MSKTAIFSPPLYREAVRQARVPGLVLGGGAFIATVLVTVLGMSKTALPSWQSLMAALPVYLYLAPVALAFTLYAFLFRRSDSDFYHALPVTRRCLFVSLAAAAVTWLAATLAVCLLFPCLYRLVLGLPVNWLYPPLLFADLLLGAMLVLSCALVGLCCTGTRLSAFVVGALLLFLPRCVLTILGQIITHRLPQLTTQSLGPVFDNTLNFPVGLFLAGCESVMGYFSGYVAEETQLYASLPTLLYTAALAALYFAVAGTLFRRRQSETAGKAAASTRLQHTYRCLLTLPTVLGAGALLATDNGGNALFWVLVALSLLLYFSYELLTTRKWRNLLAALYVLPLVLVVGLALSYGAVYMGRLEASREAEASQIESVTLKWNQRAGASYQTQKIRKVSYREDEIKTLIADAQPFTKEYYEARAKLSQADLRARFGGADYIQTVEIHLQNGRVLHRRLRFPEAKYQRLLDLVEENKEYQDAYLALPETANIDDLQLCEGLTAAQTQEVWQAYQKDIAALAFADANGRITDDGQMTSEEALEDPEAAQMARYGLTDAVRLGSADLRCSLQVTGHVRFDNFRESYRITALTPTAMRLALRYLKENQADTLERAIQKLSEMGASDWMDMTIQARNAPLNGRFWNLNNVYLSIYYDENGENQSYYSSYDSLYDKQEAQPPELTPAVIRDLLLFLRDNGGEDIDLTKPYVLLELNMNDKDGGTDANSLALQDFFFPLTEEALQTALKSLTPFSQSCALLTQSAH